MRSKNLKNFKIGLGIDADVSKSGISFLTRNKQWIITEAKLYDVRSLIITTVSDLGYSLCDLEVKIELAGMDSAAFGLYNEFCATKRQIGFKSKPSKPTFGAKPSNRKTVTPEQSAFARMMKRSRDIGRNIQIGEEILKILREELGIGKDQIKRIAPSERVRLDGFPFNRAEAKEIGRLVKAGGKKMRYPTKMKHLMFCELTKITDKTTNPEKRDSALLFLHEYLNL